MATNKQLIPGEELLKGRTDEELREWVRNYLAERAPQSGCDACRFENVFAEFNEPLCSLPDISKEDFALGVAGVNCSRFQPRKRVDVFSESEIQP
jgi:hypothetical protein